MLPILEFVKKYAYLIKLKSLQKLSQASTKFQRL